MNTRILIALLLASPIVFGKNLPEHILKQLPLNDHSVITSASNDFDNNGLLDYVIALRDNKESNTDTHVPRSLLVFMQMSKGSYKLIARNESIVYAADDGGIGGDPFDYSDDGGLVAKGKYFTVENSVAGGIHWTDFITFKYNPSLHNFQFHLRVLEYSELNSSTDPNADALVVTSHKEYKGNSKKLVLLSDYKPF